MKLVNADKFIDWIDLGHSRHPSELCFSEIDVVNMINHQPTAYDVEAVVRELEEERKSAYDNFEKYRMPSFWREAYAFVDAIEIVLRGGRNE